MARPLWAVITAIKTVIPTDYENRAFLLNALNKIADDAAYTAPELMHVRWEACAYALATHVGDPKGISWKEEVQGIFNDKIDYKNYLQERT